MMENRESPLSVRIAHMNGLVCRMMFIEIKTKRKPYAVNDQRTSTCFLLPAAHNLFVCYSAV